MKREILYIGNVCSIRQNTQKEFILFTQDLAIVTIANTIALAGVEPRIRSWWSKSEIMIANESVTCWRVLREEET